MTLRSSIISLLFLLAIGVSSLLFHVTNHTNTEENSTDTEQVDASMENVVATIFDKLGNPSLKIVAPKMIHYLKSDITEITTPKITYTKETNNTWYINSDYAQAQDGVDKIIFRDNVIVRHQSDANHPTTTMHTKKLTIFPEKQTAETNEAVSIIQPEAKIKAVGMLADMKEGTVKLLSKAKEEYVPAS